MSVRKKTKFQTSSRFRGISFWSPKPLDGSWSSLRIIWFLTCSNKFTQSIQWLLQKPIVLYFFVFYFFLKLHQISYTALTLGSLLQWMKMKTKIFIYIKMWFLNQNSCKYKMNMCQRLYFTHWLLRELVKCEDWFKHYLRNQVFIGNLVKVY